MRWLATALEVFVLAIAGLAGWIWLTTNFNATGGKGWSLIGATRSYDLDSSHTLGAVPPVPDIESEPVGLGNLMSRLGLQGPQAVDFDRQLVIHAVGIGSGSCPLHLDDVHLTDDRIVVETSSGFAMACSGDAVPYSFLLRVDRDRLPDWPLRIEVRSDGAVREAEIGPWVRDQEAG